MKRKLIAVISIAASLFGAANFAQMASAATFRTIASSTQYPIGIVQSSLGDVFIVDNNATTVSVIPHGTTSVKIYGHTYTGGFEAALPIANGMASLTGAAIDPISKALFVIQGSGEVWAMAGAPTTLFGVTIDQAHVGQFVQINVVGTTIGGIDFDSHGNLFAASNSGGIFVLPRSTSIYGQSFTPNAPASLDAGNFFGSDGDFIADVAIDKTDNLYAAAMFGPGTGFYVLSAGASTILGHSVSTSAFTSLADASVIAAPCGIDVDESGRVFVGDWGTNNVFAVSPKSETVFDTEVTANVVASLPTLDHLANQGVSISGDGTNIYLGALEGVWNVKYSPNVSSAPKPTVSGELANTGGGDSAPLGFGLVFVAAGLLLLRKTRRS